MVIPSTNISFLAIQNEFDGIKPIDISEYYSNSSTYYTSNISSLPLINNAINIGLFSTLAKDSNHLYTTPGTYSYTVPVGIKTLCVLCVGGGGSGRFNAYDNLSGGGGGGALIWVNSISVTVGQVFNIIVGNGGDGPSAESNTYTGPGLPGMASRFYFVNNSIIRLNILADGGGGAGGGVNGAGGAGGVKSLTNTEFTIGGSGGGNGGAGGAGSSGGSGGGGGAAGYTGNGGAGGTSSGNGGAGLGGGGGGGGAATNSGGAGGVGILNGQGASGTGGISAAGGSGGSDGASGKSYSNGCAGGAYGGGGGGNKTLSFWYTRHGGNGAVRIMALGKDSNRSFPYNAKAF